MCDMVGSSDITELIFRDLQRIGFYLHADFHLHFDVFLFFGVVKTCSIIHYLYFVKDLPNLLWNELDSTFHQVA